MSSKFSTPFMKKSPLHGAYTSGDGGMVYTSNRDIFQKLQDDITSATKEAIEGKNPCSNSNITSYKDKDGNTKKCP